MDITFEKKDGQVAILSVGLKEPDFQKPLAQKIKETAKSAHLKGFRPGKVPPAIIEKMYGKSLKLDVINDLISEAVNGYLRDNEVQILGNPIPYYPTLPEEKPKTEDSALTFEFEIGLRSQVTLPNLTELEFTKHSIHITGEDLARIITGLREKNGTSTTAEISEPGDTIFGDLLNETTNQSIYTGIPINKVLEAKQELFVGKAIGDEISFVIEETFTEANARLVANTGKEAVTGIVRFTVKNINRNAPAELGPEFYKKIFRTKKIESYEEFLAHVKTDVEREYNEQISQYEDDLIYHALMDKSTVELPEDFLKRWLVVSNPKASDVQLEQAWPGFISRTKWDLVLDAIFQKFNLAVTDADLEHEVIEHYEKNLKSMGIEAPDHEMLHGLAHRYLEEDKGKNREQMFNLLVTKRLSTLIAQNSVISEKAITIPEYEQIIQEFNNHVH